MHKVDLSLGSSKGERDPRAPRADPAALPSSDKFQLQLRTQRIFNLGRPHSRSSHPLLLAPPLTRLLLQLLFLDCCKLFGISQGAKKSSKGVT